MPSPFPGMDPYIEASSIWGDFHGAMLVAMRAALNARLPAGYAASGDLHVSVVEPDTGGERSLGEPDAFVAEQSQQRAGRRSGNLAVAAPIAVTLPAVPRKGRRFLKIVRLPEQRLVTAIELLSPANKASGPERIAFLAKRQDYLAAGVNLVEIDLLRRGRRMPLGSPAPPTADYYILVCRAVALPRAGIWSIGLRDPLPDILVPLDPDQADVPLPLRWCLDRTYDEGRYSMKVNYRKPLIPRPSDADAAWIRKLLARSQGHKL